MTYDVDDRFRYLARLEKKYPVTSLLTHLNKIVGFGKPKIMDLFFHARYATGICPVTLRPIVYDTIPYSLYIMKFIVYSYV